MKKTFPAVLYFLVCFISSCNHPESNQQSGDAVTTFREGQFGYDLQFLKKQDDSLVVLAVDEARVIVSPKFQAKVFTSTARGDKGQSFGWINYRAFEKKPDPHMNAYGGENRLWLGPEGGRFSLFFPPGSKMIFNNWKTPPAFDTEAWILRHADSSSVTLLKKMQLVNYAGTALSLQVERTIRILGKAEIMQQTGLSRIDSVFSVGYETENLLTNLGNQEWTSTTGMPCIWMLDMFNPSPSTVIIVPFQHATKDFSTIATTNYFGEIPASRIKHNDSVIFFRADGNSRGKMGIVADKAKNRAGSYDGKNKVLTIIQFDIDVQGRYLNQEWNLTRPSFSGDAVNAYNDGPLADGTQMGPFYEIESVSPAAFLKPHESLSHKHAVFHFTGNEKYLSDIAFILLGVSLKNINETF